MIDKASADKAGYQLGDVATVLTKSEPRQFTIAGIATFAGEDSPAGATAVLFTDATATELLATPGQADAIAVTADPGCVAGRRRRRRAGGGRRQRRGHHRRHAHRAGPGGGGRRHQAVHA